MAKFWVKQADQPQEQSVVVYATDKPGAAERFVEQAEWHNVDFPVGRGEREILIDVAASSDKLPLKWERFKVEGVSRPQYRATRAP